MLSSRDKVGKEGGTCRTDDVVLSHLSRENIVVFGTGKGRVLEQRSLSTQKYHAATDLKDG